MICFTKWALNILESWFFSRMYSDLERSLCLERMRPWSHPLELFVIILVLRNHKPIFKLCVQFRPYELKLPRLSEMPTHEVQSDVSFRKISRPMTLHTERDAAENSSKGPFSTYPFSQCSLYSSRTVRTCSWAFVQNNVWAWGSWFVAPKVLRWAEAQDISLAP